MDASHQHKLDPRLRRVDKQRIAAREEGEDKSVQVFVEVANAEAAKWVKKQPGVRKLVQVVDGYYTATVPPDRLTELAAHEGVIEIEAVRFLRPQLDHSLISIHGNEGTTGGGGVPDGRGVVIGIVDYGLDFTQKDFQNPPHAKVRDAHNPNGITRIAYLWDQQLKRKRKEHAPAKYGYGVEYSSKEIDYALQTNRFKLIRHDPLNTESAISGHGTHVAGIAAGNGETGDAEFPAQKFVGVAPVATLVFVNLDRREIVKQVKALRGTLANSVNIAHGVAYCFERADQLGMPCVVNLSLGSNGGGHDGNMALEWIIDALLQKSGRAVVIAAGNEDGADRPVHAAGSLGRGEEAALEWKIGDENKEIDDPNPNELEVWYPSGSAIKVWLVSPGDTETSDVVVPGKSGTFRFAKGEEVSIYSDPATPWNGAARIHIRLNKGARKKGIRFGTWLVKLQAIHVAPEEPRGHVRFDAWIERTLPAGGPPEEHSRFGRYDPNTAINATTPSTARRVITVASYDNDGSPNPPISGFSSRGPTRDGRFKPELAAPGFLILSTNARAGFKEKGNVRQARIKMGGTSMAAPHVAGVVARMLSRNAYLTAEEIREILVKSATPPAGGARWNSKWGYGKLNATRAVELVEHLVGSKRTAS